MSEMGFIEYATERRWLHLNEHRTGNPLWSECRRRCDDSWNIDDVDDVYSAVLEKLASAWDRSNVTWPFVQRIIQNAAIDEWRRRKSRMVEVEDEYGTQWVSREISVSPVADDNDPDSTRLDPDSYSDSDLERNLVAGGMVTPGPDAEYDGPDWRVVRRALRGLPERQRAVVELHDWADDPMTIPEIAEKLGITERPVWQRLHDGRAALRAALEPWGRVTRTVGTFAKVGSGDRWQGTDGRKGCTPEVHAAVGCWMCLGQDRHLLDGVRFGDE